jgi:hypothetical protein
LAFAVGRLGGTAGLGVSSGHKHVLGRKSYMQAQCYDFFRIFADF